MCGGGTSLIEAWYADIPAIGMDVNPVAVLTSRVATTPIPAEVLRPAIDTLLERAAKELDKSTMFSSGGPIGSIRASFEQPPDLFGNENFFTVESLIESTILWHLIGEINDPHITDFCRLAFLGILRQISRANVKKMNTEIDESKQPKPVLATFASRLRAMERVNEVLCKLPPPRVQVFENDALSPGLNPESAGMAIIHPPYLSNTAFSESVQLPLAWLGYEQRHIWKRELRCRGSYVHEPDGLRKYIIGWYGILSQVAQVIVKGGHICVVIGDGRVDYVRIPMGAITKEFAADLNLYLVKEMQHRINNNTGWTLNRRMRMQHLLVFRK
jgi:site-specific DNA-methyltransferase (cytosine-N4-specific)